MVKALSKAYKDMTTYSIGASIVLAFAGFWLILLTFPNLFYRLGSQGLPVGMGQIIDSVRDIAGGLAESQEEAFLTTLQQPLAISLPFLVWSLIAAGLIRSARAKSWLPAVTIGLNLAIGVLAFPIFAWAAQIVMWVIGLYDPLSNWVSSLLQNGVVRTIGIGIGAVALLAILIGGVAWALRSRKRIWWVLAVLVVAALLFAARAGIAATVGPVAQAVGDALAVAVGFIAVVIFAALAWLAAILVLAYLGHSMVGPVRDAWASRKAARIADVAAGVGVAISTLVTAAGYNASFASALDAANHVTASVTGGKLPNPLALHLDALMPPGFDSMMQMLFAAFNGVPDLLVVTLACGIGVLCLIFTPGPMVKSEQRPTILTLAFLRVFLLLIGVILVLLFTSFDSG